MTDQPKGNILNIIPNVPTYLIIQERSGLGRCVEYSRNPTDEISKVFVKIFEAECNDVSLLTQANLTYQGACQEALTDLSSISNAKINFGNFSLIFFMTFLLSINFI